MDNFKFFKITVTFPHDLYPEGPTGCDVSLVRDYFDQSEYCGLSREHHQSGQLHLEGIIGFKGSKGHVGHIKQDLMSKMGHSRAQQRTMTPSVKKHFIVAKAVNYLPGAIAYVNKENQMDVLQKGFESTWIQEQIVEAQQNKEIIEAGKIIYVNDSTFIPVVTEYVVKHNEDWCNLRSVLVKMHATHNFARVRNGKAHVATLMAKHNDDFSHAENNVTMWFAPDFHVT